MIIDDFQPQAPVVLSSPPSPQLTAHTLQGAWVMLRADELRLLLPQAEVTATSYLQGQLEPLDGKGLLQAPNEETAAMYVAVSQTLELLPQCPSGRFVVTELAGLDVLWCWSEVQVLAAERLLQAWALPPVLLAPYTPVREIAQLPDGHWAYVCTAAALETYTLTTRTE